MMKKCITLILVLVLLCGVVPVSFVAAEDVSSVAVEPSVADATLVLKDNWHYVSDASNIGEENKWYQGFPMKGSIISLPYVEQGGCPIIWLYNRFSSDIELTQGQKLVATFQGLNYYSKIWFNGSFIGENEGMNSKFSFDLTDYYREGEENLLVIRLYGTQSSANNTMHGQLTEDLPLYRNSRPTIQEPVYLSVVPDISMADVFVDTKYETGNVDVNIILNNPGDEAVNVDIAAKLSPDNQNVTISSGEMTVMAVPGTSTHVLTLHVNNFHAWSPDDPYLYDVQVSAKAQTIDYRDSTVIQVGFKDFRIDDNGFFRLNGERFYVKSLHVTVWSESATITSYTKGDIERLYAQLDYYKACGYNMVRFLKEPGITEMLDYCDKIGLLVYEESGIAWVGDSPVNEEIMRRELYQVVTRDRNHASFAIMGILNETYDNRVDFDGLNNFRAAVESLDAVRAYDNDVLVLISSARWDNDASIASGSNPGSDTWDAYLGSEGVDPEGGELAIGDIHRYTRLPYGKDIRESFLTYSDRYRAVFLSENGAGSAANVVSALRIWQQESEGNFAITGRSKGTKQVSTLYNLYNKYNMASAYGTPELLIRDSQSHQSTMRGILMDYIRSNYKINGHSMTMGLDANNRGEGILEGTSDMKDDMYETLRDAWADTRWCLNVDSYNVYNTQGLGVKIYLSDLGKLEVKEYTARFTVTGSNGLVWEKEVPFTPQRDADGNYVAAVLLLEETIPLTDAPTGEYRINANLVGTGISRTRTFWVTDEKDLPKVSGTVYTVGFSDEAMALMKNAGLTCIELDPENVPDGCTILLGKDNVKNRTLQRIYASVEETGTTVVGINYEAFGNWGTANLPFDSATTMTDMHNGLYHYEIMMFDTTLTNGLQDNRIATTLYYEDVYPTYYYNLTVAPRDTLALAMYIGVQADILDNALLNAPIVGAYDYGEGTLVLHTFKISDNIGTPVADRMMLNMIQYALNEC